MVDSTERGDINGLSSDGTCGSDSGAVFTRTAVDDGIDCYLDGVLVGHDVDLCEMYRLALELRMTTQKSERKGPDIIDDDILQKDMYIQSRMHEQQCGQP